jgi:hypothetical protein
MKVNKTPELLLAHALPLDGGTRATKSRVALVQRAHGFDNEGT